MSPSFVITVSGSDASGAAGMQADNRAILATGAFPLNVISAVTLQTDQGVQSIDLMAPELVRMHLLGLLKNYSAGVMKVGMLGSGEVANIIAEVLEQFPTIKLILDPVLKASSGRPLLDAAGFLVLRDNLLPRTQLLTPNLPELAELSGMSIIETENQEKEAVDSLLSRGCEAVLVKGGHRSGDKAIDRLYIQNQIHEFSGQKISTPNSRGTGCALASLIAGNIAMGMEMLAAVEQAKEKLQESLESHSDEDWPSAGPGFL